MDVAPPLLQPGPLSAAPRHGELPEGIAGHMADKEYRALAAPRWPATANLVALGLSILVTVRNQEATIAQAVSDILNVDYPCPMELIVVDDASTDGTYDLLARVGDDRVTVYRHLVRRGKSAALQTAGSLAAGSHLLLLDVGPEYSADDIPRVLRPVLTGRCQVVYGARLSGYNTVYRSRRQVRAVRMLTLLANVLFDACVKDLYGGFKLIPRAMFGELTLREGGAGLDTEITALLLKRGVRPFEVPVSYHGGAACAAAEISRRQVAACVGILFRVRLRRRAAGAPHAQHAHDHAYDGAVICSDHPNLSEAC